MIDEVGGGRHGVGRVSGRSGRRRVAAVGNDGQGGLASQEGPVLLLLLADGLVVLFLHNLAHAPVDAVLAVLAQRLLPAHDVPQVADVDEGGG